MDIKRLTGIVSGAVANCAAVVAFAGPALAQTQPGTTTFYYGPHMWGWGVGWFLGPLWILLIIGVVIAIASTFSRRRYAESGRAQSPEGRTALDILRERFARGEIDKAEFEDRKHILGY